MNAFTITSDYFLALAQRDLKNFDIDEFRGQNQRFALFTDFGSQEGNYFTIGHYLQSWARLNELVDGLRYIRRHFGINRPLSFKDRKRQNRAEAFESWIDLIRSYPGFIFLFAFDRFFFKDPEMKKQQVDLMVKALGYGSRRDRALFENAAWAPFVWASIHRFFNPTDRINWIFDRDPLFDNVNYTNCLGRNLEGMYQRLDCAMPRISYGPPGNRDTPQTECMEELLSVADLVASTFSKVLSCDGENLKNVEDFESSRLFREFAKFQNVYGVSLGTKTECKFGYVRLDKERKNGRVALSINTVGFEQ